MGELKRTDFDDQQLDRLISSHVMSIFSFVVAIGKLSRRI